MKKVLLFIVFAGLTNMSFAQLNLGLRINWTVNKPVLHAAENVEFFNYYYNDPKMFGLSGGLMANYKLSHHFSLQSEMLFNAVNMTYYKKEYYTNNNGDYRSADNDFSLQMQYLEMPLIGKMSFGNAVTFDLFAGGFIGYKLSAKKSTQDGQLNLPQDASSDPWSYSERIPYPPDQKVNADYTHFNAGILAGCGVTMHDRVILEIRLNRGLVNINKADASKMYTLQGQFTVGYYLFRQKKKS